MPLPGQVRARARVAGAFSGRFRGVFSLRFLLILCFYFFGILFSIHFFGVGVLCQREAQERERKREKQYKVCRRTFFFFTQLSCILDI